MSDEEDLVRQLIRITQAKVAPRAVLLEERIEKALAYVDQITAPNEHTLSHIRGHLSGKYDDLGFDSPAALLRGNFERRWDCRVVSTGFNNGAGCGPSDPHGLDWRCGYRWQASLTDEQAKGYGLVREES